MRLGILSKEALRHPCDTAFGMLLGLPSDGDVLYLVEQSRDQTAPSEHVRKVTAADEEIDLPYRDTSIKLVVLSLFDSWPANDRMQLRLLSEIRRVLVATGELLIVTRNRYGYSRLREMLRPRQLLFGSRRRKDAGWLPSKRTLQRLLERGGFDFAEWFRPVRDPQGCLANLRPLGSPSAWNIPRSSSLRSRIRNAAWLANEYVVRAAVAQPAASALRHCLEDAARRIVGDKTSTNGPRVERLLVTPKEKVVVVATLDERPIVMRVPLSGAALDGCQRNIAALRQLGAGQSSGGLAPLALTEGFCAAYYYTVESRIRGKAMRDLPASRADLRLIEHLITRLNPQPEIHHLEGAAYERLISAPLSKVTTFVYALEKREALQRMFSRRLRGKPLPVGITHGDLSLRNVFMEEDCVSGIIDWDESRLDGCPILDAISHLCSRQFRRGGSYAYTILSLARRQWPQVEELAFLDRCYDHFRIPHSSHAALVFVSWLNAIGGQLDLWFARDAGFLRERVQELVDAIAHNDF